MIREPVWKGPCVDGITFSLLSKFLVDRERFRLYVIDGLRGVDTFNHKIEFGNMWHVCEEFRCGDSEGDWQHHLAHYALELCNKYPLSRDQINHWHEIVKRQFQIYLRYWNTQDKGRKRSPIYSEKVFDTRYTLPSGRVVRLRGKYDSVDFFPDMGVWYDENKTKGDIDESKIKRQLLFDLQTMIYRVALGQDDVIASICKKQKCVIEGVRYKVIRRPLSGGKGTIVRHKGSKNKPEETYEDYYKRVMSYIEAEPETYFMRWDVNIYPEDVLKFQKRCLDPILENLCDWYEAVSTAYKTQGDIYCRGQKTHWIYPYGVYNPLNDGGVTELDEYMNSGSMSGLNVISNLFPEL